jgi:hypothetical protein
MGLWGTHFIASGKTWQGSYSPDANMSSATISSPERRSTASSSESSPCAPERD